MNLHLPPLTSPCCKTHIPLEKRSRKAKFSRVKLTCALASTVFAASMFCGATSAHAALLVYEGFDGYSGNITASTKPNGNTVGLNTTVGYAGSLSITTGLSFSSLQVNGGAAGYANVTTNPQLSLASSYSGTLWGSYLINIASRGSGSSDGVEIRVNTALYSGGTSYFRSAADTRNGTSPNAGVSYQQNSFSDAPISLSLNTTYLVISKFTNVGTSLSSGISGVGTLYVLTSNQFDAMVSSGNAESYLDSSTVGAGITARVSSAAVQSGTFSFASGNYLQISTQTSDSGIIDEIRYGSTLADVTPVPEPTAIAFLFLAGGAWALSNKRRRK